MSKLDLKRIGRTIHTKTSEHLPEILMATGIGAGITGTILAVQATPKALKKIEEKKEETGKDELTNVEMVQACWKLYIPATMSTLFGVGCILGSRSEYTRRSAALATAYKISETALTEYKEKVVETIGEDAEQEIKKKIAQTKVDNDPVSKKEVVVTGRDNELFYDYLSGRYFYSSVTRVKNAQNVINEQLVNQVGGYVSLNQFYEEIGLSGIGLGYELGWRGDDGLVEIETRDAIVTDDHRSAIVLDYRTAPVRDYDKLVR